MSQKFNIWLTGSNSWWMRGNQHGSPLKCSTKREDAGVFTLEEAIERCSLVLDGRPPAAMVAVPGEPGDEAPDSRFTCSWNQRIKEIESVSRARGIVEGVAEGLEVGLPNVSEKLKEAAGLLAGSCKTAPGRDGEESPHESSARPQPIHGVES